LQADFIGHVKWYTVYRNHCNTIHSSTREYL